MGLSHESLIVGAVLALLAWAGVMATLSVLAARIRGQKLRHNLVRDSRRRRHDYLAAVQGAGAPLEAAAAETAVAEVASEPATTPQTAAGETSDAPAEQRRAA